jgi:hypothetical protein
MVSAFLASPAGRELPVESRLLAMLALEPKAAALALVRLLPEISRPLDEEEVRVLAAQADVPEVAAALERLRHAAIDRHLEWCDRLAEMLTISLKTAAGGRPLAERLTAFIAEYPQAADTTSGLDEAAAYRRWLALIRLRLEAARQQRPERLAQELPAAAGAARSVTP